MGAPCGLAVDGDEVMPIWPQLRHPTLEAASEQQRIDPVDKLAQPALTRDAVMKLRKPAQEVEVVPAPGTNIVEIVATGDRRTNNQQHHLLERIHDPPGFPVIHKPGKMLQQNGHARPRDLFVQDRTRNGHHSRAPCRIRAHQDSQSARQDKITPNRPVNPSS